MCQAGADTNANTLGAAAHFRLVIFVSLRMVASAVAPLFPMPLLPRLRARDRTGDGERVGKSMGADTSWFERRAAYLSDCSVVLPLRPSARAAPPSGLRPFHERLRGHGSGGADECQWALTERRPLGGGGGALERGHGAPLEPLAQLGDALRSVGALSTIVEAAELVVAQTAKVGSDSVNGH